MDVDPPGKLEVSRPVRAVLVLCWVASVLIGAVKVATALGRATNRPFIFDFHVFMIAGRETWAGHLASAYDSPTMMALQQQAGGRDWFMPWSYPPLFGLVMAPFSQLPIVVAFCLFVLGALAGFIAARAFKRGAPPTPDMAIDEAKRIRETVQSPNPDQTWCSFCP